MRKLVIVVGLAALAGCGADGEPVTPTASTTLSGGAGGVQIAQNVGLTRGPLSIHLGWGV